MSRRIFSLTALLSCVMVIERLEVSAVHTIVETTPLGNNVEAEQWNEIENNVLDEKPGKKALRKSSALALIEYHHNNIEAVAAKSKDIVDEMLRENARHRKRMAEILSSKEKLSTRTDWVRTTPAEVVPITAGKKSASKLIEDLETSRRNLAVSWKEIDQQARQIEHEVLRG